MLLFLFWHQHKVTCRVLWTLPLHFILLQINILWDFPYYMLDASTKLLVKFAKKNYFQSYFDLMNVCLISILYKYLIVSIYWSQNQLSLSLFIFLFLIKKWILEICWLEKCSSAWITCKSWHFRPFSPLSHWLISGIFQQ